MVAGGSARVAAYVSLAAVFLLAGSGARAGQNDEADVRIGTELVLVNVVATSGGSYAGGMTAVDFQVSEDGVPQKIEFFGSERTPFAAAILLDTSGSMERKLPLARMAAARFMDRARTSDRVALYLFGTEVRRIQDFTPGGRDLPDDLWDSSAEGITRMNDCIGQACEALKSRTEPRRAVLLISDGADYGSALSYNDALRRVLASGVTVYSVDLAPIGAAPSLASQEAMRARGVLHGLAEKSGGRFFASKGGGDLNDAFTSIVDELTNQYTIGYVPSNLKHDGGWRRISVTTSRPMVKLRAREGYTAPN